MQFGLGRVRELVVKSKRAKRACRFDNNRTERSIRGWAVGRANWTFLGSDRGGRKAAVLRSFIASCELVKIDPFAWFHDVLARIPGHPVNQLDQLLPHHWAAARA